jgi:NADPH-dependent 2,4-dienoyl-CoA reductase/sulfur reductase-like enzyme/nitrite reductase/ring-hydroxylating ferredoxin subunit
VTAHLDVTYASLQDPFLSLSVAEVRVSSDEKPLSGPDLEQGVALEDLVDGQPFLGHARGESIVLVRRGNDVLAIGATCTHYGGPLAEGLVVGETIRCPWHHACFRVRSGEAKGAPALNPLTAYEVERRGETVLVRGPRREKRGAAAPPQAPESVVVVGAGPAGAACAETLRRRGYRGPVTLVGAEAPGPVDRPNLSKDYLAGDAPEEWIPLRGADFYAEQEIEFLPEGAASHIDLAARRVTLQSGRTLPYGALLLATGAEPRRLSIPGADRPHVFVLRTLAESRAIIARAAQSRRAVVIGASFIGLEVAASLRHRGLEVDVVAPESVPLARVVGEEIGTFVRARHEKEGVRFHLGLTPTAIDDDAVALSDGRRLPADLVVVGIGVVPRTALAEGAGLRVKGGVLVDSHLRASDPHVWAAGDVARYPDPRGGEAVRIEHFALAERQGQAAARSILGGDPFRDVPFFWSQHYDLTLASVGHAPSWDRIETRGSLESADFAAFYLKDGKVLSVVTLGRDLLSLKVEAAMEAADEEALATLLAEA